MKQPRWCVGLDKGMNAKANPWKACAVQECSTLNPKLQTARRKIVVNHLVCRQHSFSVLRARKSATTCELKSIQRIIWGTTIRAIKGDTRSLDNGSC